MGLGVGATTPHERRLAAARGRRYRRRRAGALRAYWRERNAARADYFRARDKTPRRRAYLAQRQRTLRAEAREARA